MYLRSLKLRDFRNYAEAEATFRERVNVITGNNGRGKTNLLESIYMLSMGKSFRTAKETEMIRFDADFLRIEGVFEKDGRDLDVEVTIGRGEKRFSVNGLTGTRNADLLENAYIVAFSPDDLRVVKEEPERRRRFVDRELFQIKPLYYKYLSRYKKSLLQRNAALRQETPNPAVLSAWEENLVNYGIKIIKERYFFSEKLRRAAGEIHAGITDGGETLDIVYEANVGCDADEARLRAAFAERLAESRAKDAARGFTSVGPHRDDLALLVNGTDARRFGSQGQQRTAALSMKLAELRIIKEETGEDAIILLDDVLSELDRERQRFLIRSLSDNQIFISAAEMSDEIREGLPERAVFVVEDGRFRPFS